jgi:DNA polymerase III subunit delta
MTFEQIFTDLKNKIYHPVYFLCGEEAYYIDEISNYIQNNVLNDAEKTFNQLVLYGKDTDIATVINSAKRFPMMANYQVVIVKEAQLIKDIDKLIYYIENPLKSTVLVINYKYSKPDKRKKVFKSLMEKSIFFESDRLYENKIPDWITNYLKRKKYTIEPKAAELLTEFLGNDLGKIVNELEKLAILLPAQQTRITSELIERNIGISKEYNNFELTKALSQRNVLKSNSIIIHLAANQKTTPIVLTFSTLYGFFSKVLGYHYLADKSRNNVTAQLNIRPFIIPEYEMASKKYPPAKVVEIISLLKEYDLKFKGIGAVAASEEDLLKELVYKILH